jgi:hypothetical protein
MTNDIKTIVTELLGTGASDIQRNFFNTETPQYTKWTRDGDVFLDSALAVGVTFEYVDSYGGEGLGEDFWSVYKFAKGVNSVLVKFDGSYQSYNGSEYDSWYFVEGREVQVTQFYKI